MEISYKETLPEAGWLHMVHACLKTLDETLTEDIVDLDGGQSLWVCDRQFEDTNLIVLILGQNRDSHLMEHETAIDSSVDVCFPTSKHLMLVFM